MKRNLLFTAAFLVLNCIALAQHSAEYGLWLKSGIFLKGGQLDTLPDGSLRLLLVGGGQAIVPPQQVLQLAPLKSQRIYLPNGTSLKKRGFYTSLSVAWMVARPSASRYYGRRSGYGFYLQRGYRWSPAFAFGLGAGYEGHEYGFLPLQMEFSGIIGRTLKRKPNAASFVPPFTWKLQAGYNLPGRRLIAGFEDAIKLRGSWLFHPSVGLLVPTRRAGTFQLDLGYRVQRYLRIWEPDWSNTRIVDKVILKSLTLRAGYVF